MTEKKMGASARIRRWRLPRNRPARMNAARRSSQTAC
jgi:hypothetical protein